ncbi:hypothetical protein [Corynebacterium hiratae]|uniref:Uncharacterized protein n=1 Tax=Corynebacterium hiratae TaxID=3139423 RepID=A0A553FXD5_9CORY|nr:hypothetical protein [Corynebacterium aurimucosum]TRX61918.1 hypothetical protein FNY97_06450 [Corynebacterium aurimucosum]
MNSPIVKILSTQPVVLPNDSRLFREPIRKYEDMTPNFLTRYDGHTIAVDVFCADDRLWFIGPSLFNLKGYAESSRIEIDGIKVNDFSWYDMSRISRFHTDIDGIVQEVNIEFGPEKFKVSPGADDLKSFEGRNVVITMNRDNKLENLRDWLINFVVNHSIDSAIIYDNRSEAYSLKEMASALLEIEGLERLYIVDWPFKFGNTGGPQQIWDSDFGIYMCWEHARWRFLQKANSVFISDADEYPVSSTNLTLVDYVEKAEAGALNYPVRNVPAVCRGEMANQRIRLHSDYIYGDSRFGLFTKKVAYQPKRIPENVQVGNHSFYGYEDKTSYTEDVIARHMRGIHYSWREDDWTYSHDERMFSAETDFLDENLQESLMRTFPDRFND